MEQNMYSLIPCQFYFTGTMYLQIRNLVINEQFNIISVRLSTDNLYCSIRQCHLYVVSGSWNCLL
jgi:hypothetical protein